MIETAAALLREAVEAGRIPGGALGVQTADGRVETAVFGLAQKVPTERPADARTVWDLASLTKVLFTTRAVLALAEAGRLDLDDPLERHLPDLAQVGGSPVRGLSLRSLLAHTSGLPAWAPLYTWGGPPATLAARVLQHPWELGRPVYSDLNFILLGLVVQRVTGLPLAAQPLDPGLTLRPDPALAAATEQDPWRGRVLVGEVHDENAFAFGGIAGHAGLFGTLAGVLAQIRAILSGTWLSRAALDEMARPQSETRTLGWERRHPNWAGGSLCSPSTIGHTGFTGTGLWIDRERGYGWTLLTNRVHPSRHVETGIMALRRAVGNAVAAAVTGAGPAGKP
ncbi:MAG TPA: serine hydrolase domain-containing protein [Alphaproteobacteria bacterium]|nr:serine hydrolase domain-containing protein [Alphaproteobacteria bacterium]